MTRYLCETCGLRTECFLNMLPDDECEDYFDDYPAVFDFSTVRPSGPPLRGPNDHSDIGMADLRFVPEHPRHDFPYGKLGKVIFYSCVAGVVLGIILKVIL